MIMKLYYKKGACSLSPHIALREAGMEFDLVAVDMATKKTADGRDYLAINPKGSIPALELDDGQLLTEGAVMVQYIADLAPAKNLAPKAGSMERYRLQEMLNFIATDLHKGHSALFSDSAGDAYKAFMRGRLRARYEMLDGILARHDYLMGNFSVADGYLYNVSRWSAGVGVDMAGLDNLTAFVARMETRPAVQAALAAEGL